MGNSWCTYCDQPQPEPSLPIALDDDHLGDAEEYVSTKLVQTGAAQSQRLNSSSSSIPVEIEKTDKDEGNEGNPDGIVAALIRDHMVFEAYELSRKSVEASGHMDTFRNTVGMICNSDLSWEAEHAAEISGVKYRLQYRWGGDFPNDPGSDRVWARLSCDNDVPFYKLFGLWQEPDVDVSLNPDLREARFIGQARPTHGIRCNIGGPMKGAFGLTQEYIEVSRFACRETGFLIECNRSPTHEELLCRGFDVGELKHARSENLQLWVMSFPRDENHSTFIFFICVKPPFPRWASKIILGFMPRFVETMLPKIFAKMRDDPALLKRYKEDRDGIYRYMKAFTADALAAHKSRSTQYNAFNLPAASTVLGRYANPES